jgi:glycerol uptake facilitator-like aquaporin
VRSGRRRLAQEPQGGELRLEILITEIVGTFVLVFGVFGILANYLATGLAPLLVLGIGLSLGGPTGYAITRRGISARASPTPSSR